MIDAAKRAAAEAAALLVRDGMLPGLGSGSTMRYAVGAIGRRVADEGWRVAGIPTSEEIAALARRCGIPLEELGERPIDLALDGADEVEIDTLRLIKGLGGALLREKMVAESSVRFAILADGTKLVSTLGQRSPLPVEISRFGHKATTRRVAELGGQPVLRGAIGAPFVTDGANFVLDCPGFFPMADPFTLERCLRAIAGVIGTGLFLLPVEQVLVGQDDGSVRTLRGRAVEGQ